MFPSSSAFDIQQTSDGFSLSKSEAGRTIYTIRASKAVQFKAGGHADLQNVHIVVYGRTHDRYDQIYGDQFTYDPQSGDIKAVGEVHIDLQGNAEGPPKPDQAAARRTEEPGAPADPLADVQSEDRHRADRRSGATFGPSRQRAQPRARTTIPRTMNCS